MKQSNSMFTFVFVRFFAALLMLNACQTKNSGTVGADGSSIDSTTVQDSAAYFAKKRKRPKVVHDSTEKVIYLTMDDGPLRGSTILNKIILDKKINPASWTVPMAKGKLENRQKLS